MLENISLILKKYMLEDKIGNNAQDSKNLISIFALSSSFFFVTNLNCHRYKLLYVSFMVTTKQNPIVNTKKIKRKEYKGKGL